MARVKASLNTIVGKTVSAVVVATNADSKPRSQMFLIFSDRTSFELWVDDGDLAFASKVDSADKDLVLRHLMNRPKSKVWSFDGPEHESDT